MQTKREVLREHLEEYLKASRKEKGEILTKLSGVLNIHKKSVGRALKREQMRDPGAETNKPHRCRLYGKDVTAALKEIWEIYNQICAERLHGEIATAIAILQRDKMWKYGETTSALLSQMSMGTMKRRIGEFHKIKAGGGRSTTKPSDLKELIPIRRGPWENPDPGYGEIDTVVHCGPTLSGDMAYTVNFTDIATTWVESAAQINKGQYRTQKSIERIERRLPFPLLGLDPDTGSEFINWILKEWCDEHRPQRIELTRSRPNHKDDNAHIEQKNYTAVRKFLGYSRIDTPQAVRIMNELYAGPLRLYINFFQPSQKCVEKVRIGSRYRRKYDKAQTPYQRVLAHNGIDPEVKQKLQEIYATLNPKVLTNEIDALVEKIFQIQKRSTL